MRLTDKACMLDITGKNNEFFYIKDNQNITEDEIFNKLGKLEDIEEELGIDLVTLFKALKNMIYLKDDNEIKKAYPILSHIKNEGYVFDVLYKRIIKLSDYGKTWALTEEELK